MPDCKPGEYITRERWGLVGGLSEDEQMSHLALWAILAAPLILGNDPRNMDAFTRRMLIARGVLSIAQDPKVTAGRRSWRGDGVEVWRRPLSDGSVALLLLNRRGNATADVAALWHRDVAQPAAVPAGCVDVESACADWAANGECTANARYMTRNCNASCPDLCRAALEFRGRPPAGEEDGHEEKTPLPAGRELYALVEDAWTGKRVGHFARGIEAHGLLPHASRLLRVTLVDAPPKPKAVPQPPPDEEDDDEEGDGEGDEDAEEEEDEDRDEDSSLREPPPPSRPKRRVAVPRKTKQPRLRAGAVAAESSFSARAALILLAQGALLVALLRSIRRVLRKRRRRQHRS